MSYMARCALTSALALDVVLPAAAQRPSDDRPFGWHRDSAGVVHFTMVAAPPEWVRERASAADVAAMRASLETFVRLMVRQPLFAPPRGFQPMFVAAPTDRTDTVAATAPLRTIVAFGAYPFVIRWRSVQDVGGPGQVSIPATTAVLTIRVNHFTPAPPFAELLENFARPDLFGDWPVPTGRVGPFVVYDEGLLIIAPEGAPTPWHALTVEAALWMLSARYTAWGAAWTERLEWERAGRDKETVKSRLDPLPFAALQAGLDSSQRRAAAVRAQVADRLARLSAAERTRRACHLPRPAVPGVVDSHIRALDDSAPPDCIPMAAENPAMIVEGRGRSAIHFIEITGFRPCIEAAKFRRAAENEVESVGCNSMLAMLGGAPWGEIQRLLRTGASP